jgi:hypothetical protein
MDSKLAVASGEATRLRIAWTSQRMHNVPQRAALAGVQLDDVAID